MAKKRNRSAQDATLLNTRSLRKIMEQHRAALKLLRSIVKSHGKRLNAHDLKLEIE